MNNNNTLFTELPESYRTFQIVRLKGSENVSGIVFKKQAGDKEGLCVLFEPSHKDGFIQFQLPAAS